MIRYCPDLTGKEQVKSIVFVRSVLNPCIKKQCIAYENGFCKKYKTNVEFIEGNN